jgi:hypothetical protein
MKLKLSYKYSLKYFKNLLKFKNPGVKATNINVVRDIKWYKWVLEIQNIRLSIIYGSEMWFRALRESVEEVRVIKVVP